MRQAETARKTNETNYFNYLCGSYACITHILRQDLYLRKLRQNYQQSILQSFGNGRQRNVRGLCTLLLDALRL